MVEWIWKQASVLTVQIRRFCKIGLWLIKVDVQYCGAEQFIRLMCWKNLSQIVMLRIFLDPTVKFLCGLQYYLSFYLWLVFYIKSLLLSTAKDKIGQSKNKVIMSYPYKKYVDDLPTVLLHRKNLFNIFSRKSISSAFLIFFLAR